ncbi:MAG TPA: aldo/keto reductase [Prolixibacteraceae bacterium]|nr:aldo/keto reductase [Prolixibacteraceae bacterium]
MMRRYNAEKGDNPNYRRDFIKKVSALAVSLPLLSFDSKNDGEKMVPQRVLGRTGEKVSILTMGGFHVGAPAVTDEDAIEIIRTSIDQGVNFMDNAWSYQKGRSETIMGQALKGDYRKKVLLMTKLMGRTLDEAKIQLETSLKRFDLDSVDLLQFHAIGHQEGDVDAIYKNGLIEWAMELRDQKVIRFIGFTGHSDPAAHIDMIERGYDWDTVQMPLNIGDHHRVLSFEKHVLPLAVARNIGVIGMKSNGMGRLGTSSIATPLEGLRYTMSLPVSTVASGIDSLEILKENLALFHNFKPYTENEMVELLARSSGKSEIIEGYRKK